jgi:tetratricopeptide (TPR) repeat protein
LALVRLKRLDDALGELRRAAELAPEQPRYAYVYAVALHSAGRNSEAMTTLNESLARHPDDRDTLLALVSFSRDAGDPATALTYAEQLAQIAPADSNIANLVQDLQRQVKKLEPK